MFLRKFDLISPPIGLSFRGRGSHSSIIAGILTIISYIIIIYFAVRYLLEFFKKKKPSAFYVNRYIEDAGIYDFNYTSFFHYIYLNKKLGTEIIDFDFNAFRVIGLDTISYDSYFTSNPLNLSLTNHWIYGYCNPELDSDNAEDAIEINDFPKAACIRKYYDSKTQTYYDTTDKNYVAPSIKHGMTHYNYSFYGIIVEKCKDDNLRKLTGFGPCKSSEAINDVITDSIINIDFLDYYIDVLDYDTPFKKYMYTSNSMLYKDSFIFNSLNFNPAMIKTNYGIVFDKSKFQYTYVFSNIERITSDINFSVKDEKGNQIYDENGNPIVQSSGLVDSFYFYMQNRLQHYERTYQKLQDVLSKIGGLGKTIFLIMGTINLLFSKFIVILDTEDFLLSIDKYYKNNINNNRNNTISVFNDALTDKISFSINNQNDKDLKNNYNKNKEISIKQITNFKNENVEQNNNITNNIYNQDKRLSYKLNDEYLNKPIKKQNFCWLQYIWYMICCGTSNKNIAYYEKFRERIISEENIIISHSNLYKVINMLGFENNEDLIFDKQYTTIFY